MEMSTTQLQTGEAAEGMFWSCLAAYSRSDQCEYPRLSSILLGLQPPFICSAHMTHMLPSLLWQPRRSRKDFKILLTLKVLRSPASSYLEKLTAPGGQAFSHEHPCCGTIFLSRHGRAMKMKTFSWEKVIHSGAMAIMLAKLMLLVRRGAATL